MELEDAIKFCNKLNEKIDKGECTSLDEIAFHCIRVHGAVEVVRSKKTLILACTTGDGQIVMCSFESCGENMYRKIDSVLLPPLLFKHRVLRAYHKAMNLFLINHVASDITYIH